MILEIEGKSITYVPGKLDDALFGGNASAEGGMEETEEETVTGCNIVLAHRLSETFFDKKAFTVYIKDFMKVTFSIEYFFDYIWASSETKSYESLMLVFES